MLTEVVMTAFLAYVILFAYDHRRTINFRQRALVLIALVMMGSMLNSLAYYLVSSRDFLSTIIAVNISMISMSVTLLVLLLQYATGKSQEQLRGSFTTTFAVLLVYNEISMGVFVYALAFGYNSVIVNGSALTDFIEILSLGVNGYLFIAPMVAEMSIFFLLRPVTGTHRIILLSLLITAAVSPTITGNYSFTQAGSLLVLIVMVAFVMLLIGRMMKEYEFGSRKFRLPWVFPIFLLMTIGTLFGSFYNGDFATKWAIYGASMVWGMAFYFVYSLGINDGNVADGTSEVSS